MSTKLIINEEKKSWKWSYTKSVELNGSWVEWYTNWIKELSSKLKTCDRLNLWIHQINVKEKEEEKSGLKGLLVL